MKKTIIVMIAAMTLFSIGILAAETKQEMRFGIRVEPDQWPSLVQVLSEAPCNPENSLGVTLDLPAKWTGNPDWDGLDQILSAIVSANARAIICTQIPAPPGDRSVVRYLAELSEHATGKSRALVLSLRRSSFSETLQKSPDELALVLKEMTVALRGNTGATVLIGNVQEEDLPLMKPLYAKDFRAYVEGYFSRTEDPTGEPSDEVVRFLESYHLGAPLLLALPEAENPIASQLLVLVSASRGVVYTNVGGKADVTWNALLKLRSWLTPSMAPGYTIEGTYIDDTSGPRPDVGIINLLDTTKMIQAFVLVPRISASKQSTISIHLPSDDATDPRCLRLPSGEETQLRYNTDKKEHTAIIEVPWTGSPEILIFGREMKGKMSEDVVVKTNYRIPVEYIIARHQAVDKVQDVFMEHYTRKAQVDYHFKLPSGSGSLDITFMNTFFYEKGIGARWVQNQLLLNGVAWKGDLPELPIIEPEKVNTLPLALTLGRDYSYQYIKDENVEGHDCYVVEFFPLPSAKGSLYKGKVWIDKKSFATIRMSVTQSGLQSPMVSSEETDYYAPFKGADGKEYWLITRVKGQQIFSLEGRNVTTERFITFGQPEVNKATFRNKIKEAENGDKPILQETDKGLRYLVKQKDGTRKIRMDQKTSRLLAAGGLYYDSSLDYPLPLVGVNYFNYDWKKTGTQVNLLAAGAVNTLSVSKVDLFPKFDGSLHLVTFTIPTNDLFFRKGMEDKEQKVKILREIGVATLGWRMNQFSKLSLNLTSSYYGYSNSSDTSDFFTLPEDHIDMGTGLSYDFSWKGLSLSASYDGHRRSNWKRWGLPGTHKDYDRYKDYSEWELSTGKTFYLPYFQKIGTSVNWMDGRDFDRFSKYQFTYMGSKSLAGYSGSGVRFNRGAIASLLYQFNVEKVVRFGVQLEQARVQPNRDIDIWQNHTGIGFNAGTVGPWKTYWTLDIGYALKSDIPAVQHNATVALLVVKLW